MLGVRLSVRDGVRSRVEQVQIVGRGFWSAALMGRSPIPLAETKSYVESLRALLRGQPAEWDGHSIPALDALESAGVSRIIFAPGARGADSMYERIAVSLAIA